MLWLHAREHYARLFDAAKAKGWSQAAIARRGGLPQTAISKLLANDKLGPSMDTFLKALNGIGKGAAQFFAEAEVFAEVQPSSSPSSSPPRPSSSLESAVEAPARSTHRRLHERTATRSTPAVASADSIDEKTPATADLELLAAQLFDDKDFQQRLAGLLAESLARREPVEQTAQRPSRAAPRRRADRRRPQHKTA